MTYSFKIKYFLPLIIFLLIATGCGGSSSNTDDSDDSSTETSALVPSELVIASPTAGISLTSSSLNATRSLNKMLAGDFTEATPQAKIAAMEELISGESNCAFTLELDIRSGEPACYGPKLNVSGTSQDDGKPFASGTILPPHDLGIWNENEAGEACAAAQLNYLIDTVALRLDNIVRILASGACAAKKEEIELPTAGNTTDLKAAMENQVTIEGDTVTIDAAQVEARAEDSGDISFTTTIETTIGDTTVTAILVNIPNAEDPTLYKGKLSVVMNSPNKNLMVCQTNSLTGFTFASVTLFEKDAENSITYESSSAHYCGGTLTPEDIFNENNNINGQNNFDPATKTGWVENYNYSLMHINPITGEAKVQYGWQAGAQDGAMRVFNAETFLDENGYEAGNAFYGFSWGIETTNFNNAIPTGMVCNWSLQGQTEGLSNFDGGLPLILHQLISRFGYEIVFRADDGATSTIRYAPTNNCNSTGGFTYVSTDTTNLTLNGKMSNDNATGAAVTNNLKPLTFYTETFTPLTPPEDI